MDTWSFEESENGLIVRDGQGAQVLVNDGKDNTIAEFLLARLGRDLQSKNVEPTRSEVIQTFTSNLYSETLEVLLEATPSGYQLRVRYPQGGRRNAIFIGVDKIFDSFEEAQHSEEVARLCLTVMGYASLTTPDNPLEVIK